MKTGRRSYNRKDLTGLVFERLRVVNEINAERCIVQCACGQTKEVARHDLMGGNTKSCGCLSREGNQRTHGLTDSSLYCIWTNIKTRCFNPNSPSFKNYGGRGIVMCKEWAASFPVFVRDMGERPSGMTIERKDSNAGYFPENCKWATHQEQQNNRRNNRRVEHLEKNLTVAEWSRELGLSASLMYSRIERGATGSSIFAPVLKKRRAV